MEHIGDGHYLGARSTHLRLLIKLLGHINASCRMVVG
jgi:hypothetical protein